jgi:methyl-accepting chemotaxis protein
MEAMKIFKNRKMITLSLKTILALTFIVFCVVTLSISGVFQIVSQFYSQQETIQGRQEIIAREAKNTVNGFIQDRRRVLSTAAALMNLTLTSREQQQTLAGLIAIEQYFRNVVILDERGQALTSSSRLSNTDAKRFIESIDKTKNQMLSTDQYISDIYINEITNEPMVVLSVTIRDVFKEVRGLLAAELNLKFMWDLMDTIKVGSTGKGNAYVVDRKGTLIAFKDISRVIQGENVGSLKTVAEFIRSTGEETSMGIWEYRGISSDEVIGTYLSLKTPDWAVVTELPIKEAYAEVTSNTINSIIITLVLAIVAGVIGVFIARNISASLGNLTRTAVAIAGGDSRLVAEIKGSKETVSLGEAFNSMTEQLRNRMDGFKQINETLTEIVSVSKGLIVNLNSSAKEIEAAAQEQTSASNEHASGITEVSATLQELTITAKQITTNVGELVYSSEETVKLLKENEKQLLETVTQLEDVGVISKNNTTQINELGKRSVLINEMVELIKEVANKTNILSINASIEASRSGEAGAGFSVVAAEIRELSKETIESAKKADIAAKEIKDFLNSIIISSENESGKVLGSGKTVKSVFDSMGNIVSKINNNYGFTQKIDVSIKQQENGSIQAAETMRQMAEIARQSAETARQILSAVKDIVVFSTELGKTVAGAEGTEAKG